MVEIIITALIEIYILLWGLKSGWILVWMSNLPGMELVSSAVSVLTGAPVTVTPSAVPGFFGEEILKALLTVAIFTVVDKVIQYFFRIGKYENCSPARRFITRPFMIISSYFITAIVTAALMEYVYNYLKRKFSAHPVISGGLIVLIIIIVLLAAYSAVKYSVEMYSVWVTLGVVLPNVIKILAIEFMSIFLYVLLNIPGMLEQVGTLLIIIIGIICCIGSVCGSYFLEDKVKDDVSKSDKRGRHARR